MSNRHSSNLKFLVDRHGRELTLRRNTQGTYSPTTGVSTETFTDYPVVAYFYDYQLSEIDGTNVVYGDRKLLMSLYNRSGAAIPEPQEGDSILGAGDEVKVVGHSTIYSVTPVVYLVQVRE